MARQALETNAYVLHSRPYRETSLLVDLLTREHGKMRCVVRGAKSKKSSKFALLQPFSMLHCELLGQGELRTLGQLEMQGAVASLNGTNLFCGMYLNELLQRICPADYADPALFDAYRTTLSHLQQADEILQGVLLREFELFLLSHLGVLSDLRTCAHTNQALTSEGFYHYVLGQGVQPCMPTTKHHFTGAVFLQVAEQQWEQASLQCAKYICRLTIADLLGDKPLKSRELFKAMTP